MEIMNKLMNDQVNLTRVKTRQKLKENFIKYIQKLEMKFSKDFIKRHHFVQQFTISYNYFCYDVFMKSNI